MSWAQIPSGWIRSKVKDDGTEETYPLAELIWSDHKASAIAAIFVLLAMALKLNLQNKKNSNEKQIRTDTIGVTYDELRKMTGFARSAIARSLSLLEMFGAIATVKVGRANRYQLIGLSQGGSWSQMPQTLLLKTGDLLVKSMPRNRVTLNSMKIFLVIITLRNQKLNTTAIGYSAISKWTGVRRQDIPSALSVLAALNLVLVSTDRDFRHSNTGESDQSHRYAVVGLRLQGQSGKLQDEVN
jgi:hypothetical protein